MPMVFVQTNLGAATQRDQRKGSGTLLTRWTEFSLDNRVENILARCWRATKSFTADTPEM